MATIPFDIRNRWTGEVQFTAQIECDDNALPGIRVGLAVRWARKSGADLRDADLRGAVLSGADLRGAVLSGADLRDAVLSGADLRDADLSGADLRDADLSGAVLSGADLRGAVLSGADLRDAVLRDADLRGAVLSGAVLRGADLRDAVLSGAVLRGADLRDAVLSGADLRDAVLRPFRADLWEILAHAQSEIPALVAKMREGEINGSVYSGECACLVGTLEKAGAEGLPRDCDRPAERWFMMIAPGDKPGDDTGGGFAITTALAWTLDYCRLHGIAVDDATSEAPAAPTT